MIKYKNMKKYLAPIILVCLLIIIGVIYFSKIKPVEYAPVIHPENFTSAIDNKYFTLTPGTTFEYVSINPDNTVGSERISVDVTSEKKIVMGVETVVVHDQAFLDNELIEDTYDWYAQDAAGNVWYFGEATQTFENGVAVSTEGSWEAGVDGAQPGIIMLANPQVGDEYRQEYYKDVAEDMGTVVALNETIELGMGNMGDASRFTGCLKTRDWTPLEAKIDEFKFYCPELGNLGLELGVYNDERIELWSIEK